MAEIIFIKTFKKKQIVLRVGETYKEAFFIKKGLLRIYHQVSNGTQKTFVISKENNLFSEHSSFTSQKPSTEYIESLKETEVLYFRYDDMMKLYENLTNGNLLVEK